MSLSSYLETVQLQLWLLTVLLLLEQLLLFPALKLVTIVIIIMVLHACC